MNLADGTDSVNLSVGQWLSSLDCTVVIDLYQNLRDQICDCNGWVVSTNAALHNATGSSTNACLLGNAQQSCASLFYVMPYLCKNKVKLEACLIALEQAQEHVEKYGTNSKKPEDITEDGKITDKRFVQNMFIRVVNELSRSIQISDSQVALSLLNMGTEITSDSYKYFGADYGVNHFMHHFENDVTPASKFEELFSDNKESSTAESDSESEDSDSDSEAMIAEEDDEDEDTVLSSDDESITQILDHAQNEEPLQQTPQKSFGPAGIYKVYVKDTEADIDGTVKSKSVPVHYPAHWW